MVPVTVPLLIPIPQAMLVLSDSHWMTHVGRVLDLNQHIIVNGDFAGMPDEVVHFDAVLGILKAIWPSLYAVVVRIPEYVAELPEPANPRPFFDRTAMPHLRGILLLKARARDIGADL